MTALVPQTSVVAPPDGIEWSATHLQVVDVALSFEAFEEAVRIAGAWGDAARWWLGDLLLFGEARYGERFAQALDASRLSERQLSRYRYVAERVARSRRRENLPFSYHEEVAPLEPRVQGLLLERAEDERWPREQLREAVRDARAPAPLSPPPTRPRQEVLDAPETVDAARNLSTARATLERVGSGLAPETAEAVGIPQALRAITEVGATLRRAAEGRPADGGLPLRQAARRLVRDATTSGGFAMIPILTYEQFVAAFAADERGDA